MKDTYNREVDYLRISVTDRCNLRCLYCMPEGIVKKDREEIINDDEILEVVKESIKLGIKKVRITGGEPLVRRGIYELISKINELDGLNEIVLTTNGTLLIGNVKKLKDAGVTRVNLSLDSLNTDEYGKIINTNVTFDYLSLIQELKEEGLVPIKINCVLLKGVNDHEILDFLELSEKYDVQVRFIELMPFDSPNFEYKKYYISKQDVLAAYPDLTFIEKSINVEYYSLSDSGKSIGFINAISNKFCEDCNRLRLTSDGYLKPCLHSDNEIFVKNKHSEELIEKIKEAIKDKPKQHKLDKKYVDKSKRSMNKIGG